MRACSFCRVRRSASPRPSNSTTACSPSRARVAVPIAAQAARRPAKPKSASAPIAASSCPQRKPRALTAKRNEGSPGSLKSARPRSVARPSNTRTASGSTVSTSSAMLMVEGSSTATISPWRTEPCRRAVPLLPVARRSKPKGVAGAVPRPSSDRSSASLTALKVHSGSCAPRTCALMRSGAGALPPTPTSMAWRSPRASRPMRAGVAPRAAGNTAVASRSVR